MKIDDKELIIRDYIESITDLKSVCPICVNGAYYREIRHHLTNIRMHRNNVKKVYCNGLKLEMMNRHCLSVCLL